MSTLTELFTNIADAIRAKKGTQETIIAENFPIEIANLPSGSEPLYLEDGISFKQSDFHSQFPDWLKNINTSKMTNMTNLFYLVANGGSNADFSKWDTSNVTKMTGMFTESSFRVLDLSSFNTSKVTTMVNMFWGATSLNVLNLNGWDTSNVTHFTTMFYKVGWSYNTQLDISTFNTSKRSIF